MKKFLLSLMAIFAFVGVCAQNQVEFGWSATDDWTQDGDNITRTVGSYTISVAKADGSSKPTINGTALDLRSYASNVFTITADGKVFTKIVFTVSDQGKKRLGDLTPSSGEIKFSSDEAPVETVTWEGDPTSELTITVGAKATYGSDGASKAAQFDVNSPIVITEKMYIEVDYTSRLNINAGTGGWVGASGMCATNFAPAITTKDGRTAQLAENYQGNVNATGDLITQTVTGLPNGTYRVSIYANAFYTSGRGFDSDVEDGAEDVCYVFAGTGENRVEKFITAHIATSTTANDLRTLDNVQVVDGTLVVGLGKAKAGTNWHTVQVYEITALVDAEELLQAANASYEAVKDKNMEQAVADALVAAKAAVEAEITAETLNAYNDAITAAQNSAAAYEAAEVKLAAMKELVDATNFYTAEALAEYYGNPQAKFEAKTLTAAEAATLQNPTEITGWHANTTVDNLLLSVWDADPDVFSGYYINSWSTEGETDGTDFRVPFFEYWTGDANSLGARELTATLEGLEAGKVAQVSVWARVRAKDGTAAADATGITFTVNDGTAVDITEGETNGQFNLAQYSAIGVVGEDGKLIVKFIVDADNNISWLSFKNVKYVLADSETEFYYDDALASITDGQTYRVLTEVGENKFYLKADGYLTANIDEAKVFNFAAVNVEGTLYPTGWNLGCKFTNPSLTGGATGDIVQNGHINVGGNNRDDWERQVFFLKDGKYAVRATNANSANWGANTYWTVTNTEAELPNADYQLEPAYVWQLDKVIDYEPLNTLVSKLEATIAATETYNDESNAAAVATAVLEEVKAVAEYESNKAVNEAAATVKAAAQAFVAAIEPLKDIDITEFYITNATPIINHDGWEVINGTAENQWAGNTYADGVAEFWNYGGSTIKQAVTLPAGDFKLTAEALTRTGMVGTLFAGENTTEIATVESGVVNSRSAANTWFNEGNGLNELPFTMDAAGELEIGITTDNTTGDHWTVWRQFQLFLAGPAEPEVFEYGVTSVVDECYEGLPIVVDLDAILASIGAASTADITVYSETPSGDRIEGVLSTTDGWRNAEGAFEYWGTSARFYIQDNNRFSGDDLDYKTYYVGGMENQTGTPDSWTAKLVYVNNVTNAEAFVFITMTYVTLTDYYIVNADLTGEGGWDTTNTKGLDGSGVVKVSTGTTFDFKQTIVLPMGQWKLTAQAAYRYTGAEQSEYDAIQAGTDTKKAVMYATVGEETTETLVQNRWDGASDTDYAAGSGSTTVEGKFVPNSTNAVKAWFQNGEYVNEVIFNVLEETEVVIGIRKPQIEEADYTVLGPWTIERLGDPNVEMEISDLDIEASVEYADEELVKDNYVEKIATLTDEQVQSILNELGLTSLAEATVYGYNPTTGEFVSSYDAYDGWRNADGDFEYWGANAPFCVKYTDGQNYYCYPRPNSEHHEYVAYWAITNGTKAVLVKITFVTCTAVNGVEADTNKAEVIYDLAGRRVNKAVKGIYIVNGKKVLK